MGNPIYLIIIAIIIPLTICFLIIKYFLFPLFFKPRLSSTEAIKIIESKNCLLIDYSPLTQKEKNRFKKPNSLNLVNLFSIKSQYKLIGQSINDNKYRLFWLEIKSLPTPFIKRKLDLKEENNSEILTELQQEYHTKSILVTDKCPACESSVTLKVLKCPDCGLNFS